MIAPLDLDGRVVLVTGGARGIGLETARLARERGAAVAVLDLDPEAVGLAAAGLGGGSIGVAADVTDPASLEAAVDRVIAELGGIDAVIAAAGITPPKTTARAIDPDTWERVVEVNTVGIFNTVKATIEPVIAAGGHITLVASVYAAANGMLNTAYAVSKAGVEAFGRGLRTELAPHGATASVACFGFVDTGLSDSVFGDELADRFRAEIVPSLLTDKIPVAVAAGALIEATTGRLARVIEPPVWRAPFWLRGQSGPFSDRQLERNPKVGEFIREFELRDLGPEAVPDREPVRAGQRYRLAGKTVLVTGGARGIGFELARQAHGRGASVALLDLDGDAAREAAARLGPRALGLVADVTDREALDLAFAATRERFGGIDVVVANAGLGARRSETVRSIDPDEWRRIYEIDLLGVWRTVRAGIEDVVGRGGQFVLASSSYAFMNGMLNSPYATAKAGVEALGRGLRAELTPLGASVTVAYFGWIDTELVDRAFADPVAEQLRKEAFPAWATRRVPASRAGRAVIRALERRSPRAIAPAEWQAMFQARGQVGPFTDRQFDSDAAVARAVHAVESR